MLYQTIIFALLVSSGAEWVQISTFNPILYEENTEMEHEEQLSLQNTFNQTIMAKDVQKVEKGLFGGLSDEENLQSDYEILSPENVSDLAFKGMKLNNVKAFYEEKEHSKNSSDIWNIPTEVFQSVQRSLLLGVSQQAKKKIVFLQGLQNTMLSHIENMLGQQWSVKRQARFEKGMAFPSMEGTLMSISFLIFAVFLVKLVQQLIQSLQGGSVPSTPTMLVAGRRRRSLTSSLEVMQVLHFINNHEWSADTS
ncbi:uncharacterized protein LOC124619700 [Schistocerca americana]|uniref:uncharacterized protein LOC124619700 n=1 Tax=Schistocerca americana TaxID=7009 RepID=UPI001F4FBCA6|nr:uncharacterized protein LOC124619700 [Schistocerca americana]